MSRIVPWIALFAVATSAKAASPPAHPYTAWPAPASAEAARGSDGSRQHHVGELVEVLWEGACYPGSVLREDDGRWFIHYDGYDASWDEWVGPDRIRARRGGVGPGTLLPVGARIDVLWEGAWYPASVLRAGEGRWFIHYDGYEASWDEWVGPDRVRQQ